MTHLPSKICFAPQLVIPHGVTSVKFYEDAFGAVELRRWENEDGSLHVVEMSIDGALFHLHEEKAPASISPLAAEATTVTIGLFVEDVDGVISQAVRAGATEIAAARDHDYGYRQGEIRDPFGHLWLIERSI